MDDATLVGDVVSTTGVGSATSRAPAVHAVTPYSDAPASRIMADDRSRRRAIGTRPVRYGMSPPEHPRCRVSSSMVE
ncbi:hypothetical protein DK926_04455 [Rhodococcus sp. Eu-32]|nr:hypothetical protein DK926_04455 [Rhodococcus sp. Eu-32]